MSSDAQTNDVTAAAMSRLPVDWVGIAQCRLVHKPDDVIAAEMSRLPVDGVGTAQYRLVHKPDDVIAAEMSRLTVDRIILNLFPYTLKKLAI